MNVVLIAAVSADGFIAADPAQSSLEWTSKEDKAFFVSKTKELGTMVMGRKTFETIGRALPDRRMIVLTRQPGERAVEGVEFTSEAPRALLERLKREGVPSVAVCGGGEVYAQFLREGLVDEAYVTVEPVLFGAGTPLAPDCGPLWLERLSAEPLGPALLCRYRVMLR